MDGFLIEPPTATEIPFLLVSYFHSKNWAFETPLPLEISTNLPWGGHGYFLELHNHEDMIDHSSSYTHGLSSCESKA